MEAAMLMIVVPLDVWGEEGIIAVAIATELICGVWQRQKKGRKIENKHQPSKSTRTSTNYMNEMRRRPPFSPRI